MCTAKNDHKIICCVDAAQQCNASACDTCTRVHPDVKEYIRICTVLGVKMGQIWEYGGKRYRVSQHGIIQRLTQSLTWVSVNAIACCNIINHPEKIEFVPWWTRKDAEDAKALRRFFPDAKTLKRATHGEWVYVVNENDEPTFSLPADCFTFLKPGEEISLDRILNTPVVDTSKED